jgi:hypothetical protein
MLPAMLDWFSGYVGYDASGLVLGEFFEVEPGGEVVRRRDRWETARGSWRSGVQITRAGPTDQMLENRDLGFLCADDAVLRLSGNPSKFLQGHNVAGPSVSLLGPVLQALARAFPEGFRPADADDDRLPCVQRSRLDVTTSVELGSHQAVHDWLKLAGTMTRSRHGRALDSSGTVYWGKNSRRWSLKAYCKHCELGKHLPENIELLGELLEWTRTQLRIELTLRRPELKDRGTLSERVIWEYAHKLEIPTMKEARRMEDMEMKPRLRVALQVWLDGTDLAAMLPKATFYRYRRELLDQAGIDISMSAAAQVEADSSALLGIEELQAREVVKIPERIQRSLFVAGL